MDDETKRLIRLKNDIPGKQSMISGKADLKMLFVVLCWGDALGLIRRRYVSVE